MYALNSHNAVLLLALLCVHAVNKHDAKKDPPVETRKEATLKAPPPLTDYELEAKDKNDPVNSKKSTTNIPDKNNVDNIRKKADVPAMVSSYNGHDTYEWNPLRGQSLPMVTCSYVEYRAPRMRYDDCDKESPRPHVAVLPQEEDLAMPDVLRPVEAADELVDERAPEGVDEVPELVDLIARASAVPIVNVEPILVELLVHTPLVVENALDDYQDILAQSQQMNDLWPSYTNDILLTHDMVKSKECAHDPVRDLVNEMDNPMSIAVTSLYMTYYAVRNMARGFYDWCFSSYTSSAKPVVTIDDIW